jgi:TPR repeat protein
VSGGSGGEELALAQRYLNGTNGQGRNSAEAAKWLWKAIAKHNAEATLLLSDLYLRGDGVSKNCDQARVLLDTAALKGVKDAGERLRHLQAFGCQ